MYVVAAKVRKPTYCQHILKRRATPSESASGSIQLINIKVERVKVVSSDGRGQYSSRVRE
jgi:hypothetical protein